MRDGFHQARLPALGVTILDPGVDVLNAGHLVGGVLWLILIVRAGAGEKHNVAGPGQGMQGFERNEVDRVSVSEDEFEAVLAVDQALSRRAAFLARSPGLVVGTCNRGETDEKANNVRVRRKRGE